MSKINPEDILGCISGKLTIKRFLATKPYVSRKDGHLYRQDYFYECQCACGKKIVAKRSLLLTRHIKSCGCLKPGNRLRELHPSWKGHGGISSTMWKYFQSLAKVRGLAFDITIEQAWAIMEKQKGKCALSGVPIEFASATSGISPDTTASLDRIDSSKGYIPGNIQWVHKTVNRMKQALPQSEFVGWCETILIHSRGIE